MTRTTRRVLFFIALAIFLAASYFILLYAQGYLYDFSTGAFVRSGAIYLKVNTPADIYLNGKNETGTSLLTNSASIGSLAPKTYTLSVQRAGYSTWQKKVTITAGFVEDFTHVMILPQTGQDEVSVRTEIKNLLYPPTPSPTPTPSATATPRKTPRPTPTPSPTPTPAPSGPFYLQNGDLFVSSQDTYTRIASNVSKAVISPDGDKVAWYSGSQVWIYWLNDTNYQPVHQAGDVALIARFSSTIKALAWFRDSDHLALDVSGAYKVIEIDTRPGLNIINF